jgi:hypothetical protein
MKDNCKDLGYGDILLRYSDPKVADEILDAAKFFMELKEKQKNDISEKH